MGAAVPSRGHSFVQSGRDVPSRGRDSVCRVQLGPRGQVPACGHTFPSALVALFALCNDSDVHHAVAGCRRSFFFTPTSVPFVDVPPAADSAGPSAGPLRTRAAESILREASCRPCCFSRGRAWSGNGSHSCFSFTRKRPGVSRSGCTIFHSSQQGPGIPVVAPSCQRVVTLTFCAVKRTEHQTCPQPLACTHGVVQTSV